MGSTQAEQLLDTIASLAMEIAGQCPDAAERACQIVSLVGDIRATGPVDRGAVQDVLESRVAEGDLSDVGVRTTADEIVRAVRKEG